MGTAALKAIVFIATALTSVAAQAAPRAVKCSIVSHWDEAIGGQARTPPAGREGNQTLILVLDDTKQSLQEYDAKARSLTDVCERPDCSLKYGAAKITYSKVSPGPSLSVSTFELDREAGTIKANFTTADVATLYRLAWTREGTCQPTDMPPLNSAKRKF